MSPNTQGTLPTLPRRHQPVPPRRPHLPEPLKCAQASAQDHGSLLTCQTAEVCSTYQTYCRNSVFSRAYLMFHPLKALNQFHRGRYLYHAPHACLTFMGFSHMFQKLCPCFCHKRTFFLTYIAYFKKKTTTDWCIAFCEYSA